MSDYNTINQLTCINPHSFISSYLSSASTLLISISIPSLPLMETFECFLAFDWTKGLRIDEIVKWCCPYFMDWWGPPLNAEIWCSPLKAGGESGTKECGAASSSMHSNTIYKFLQIASYNPYQLQAAWKYLWIHAKHCQRVSLLHTLCRISKVYELMERSHTYIVKAHWCSRWIVASSILYSAIISI